MNKKLAEIISTIFYAGYFPVASGTLGTVIGMVGYYFVKNNRILYFLTMLAILTLGFLSSHWHEKATGKKDPHEVIIDEAGGVFIAYLFIPFSFKLFIAGFFIYRLFDIIKPPPVRWVERLPGGIGIMTDDILAALYTNLILHILIFMKLLR